MSEKDETVFLKRVLKQFLAAKRPRNVNPVKHTRYVPKALRQRVKVAAQHRCSFRSASGVQCNQTAHLEIDHIRPWAKGGSSRDIENLRVLCKAHNLLAAKQAFPDRRGLRNKSKPLARETKTEVGSPFFDSGIGIASPCFSDDDEGLSAPLTASAS